jgi:glutamate-1-semialdehyde 2,1-aminomutase
MGQSLTECDPSAPKRPHSALAVDATRLSRALAEEERRFAETTAGSHHLYQSARQVLVGGVPSSYQLGDPWPLYLSHGNGPAVWDVDGTERIDYHAGFGAMVQGHAHPVLVREMQARYAQASHMAAPTEDAVLVAKALSERFRLPRWRFTSSGSEATADAIRIARAYTGRDAIVKAVGSYHGHHDAVLVGLGTDAAVDPISGMSRPASAGIPDAVAAQTLAVPFNDAPALKRLLSALSLQDRPPACFILEPAFMLGLANPEPGYLEAIRDITRQYGVVLIFDEVKTGLTIAAGGAAERYGVMPDMVTLAKALGAGLPSGAIGSTEEIMAVVESRRVLQAGTFNGNALTMAAARASLTDILTPAAYIQLERIGARIVAGCRAVLDEHGITGHAVSAGARGCVAVSAGPIRDHASLRDYEHRGLMRLTWLHAVNRGIYVTPARPEQWTLSVAHTEKEADVYVEVFQDLVSVLTG